MVPDAVDVHDNLGWKRFRQYPFKKRNHACRSCTRAAKKLKSLLAALILGAGAVRADWHLLIEPKFMHYEAAWPIAGSDRTVLVPARFLDGEVLPLRRAEITQLGVNREKILVSATAAAAKVLAAVKTRYVRDDNKVIQYAVLDGNTPLTASAVLAPDFTKQFRDTLGPDVLIAIPNRFRIFVFPKHSPAYLKLADLIVAEYQSAPYPVSREIFEIHGGELRAVGRYR